MSEIQQGIERELKGLSVSKGIAHGEAFVMFRRELETPVYEIRDSDKPAERERFQNAILKTRADIQQIKAAGMKAGVALNPHTPVAALLVITW